MRISVRKRKRLSEKRASISSFDSVVTATPRQTLKKPTFLGGKNQQYPCLVVVFSGHVTCVCREGEFIVAGSDDGTFIVWDRRTTNIVRVLRGDDAIVNCLQPHPSTCLLATSGIDPVVRLWSPRPETGTQDERVVENGNDVAAANQKRMQADPIETMLLNMGYAPGQFSDLEESTLPPGAANVACRPS